ncbi:MAG: hypothetical protein WAL89_18450 [Candidatus Sulfotelmatobacter sp.]
MRRTRRPYLFVVFVVLLSFVAEAQISPEHQAACDAKKSRIADAYCQALDKEFENARSRPTGHELDHILLEPTSQPLVFLRAVFTQAYLRVVSSTLTTDAKSLAESALQTETNQLAQVLSTKMNVPQTGANANTSGSTNLVSKPTTTDLISLASESGAFTDTVNGTTLTAQANANGLRRYLAGETFSSFKHTSLDVLQNLTLTTTFNVAQSGTTSAPTTGQATATTPSSISSVLLPSNNLSFTSVGANWVVYRPYSPTSTKFTQSWNAAISTNQNAISDAGKQLYTDYTKLAWASVSKDPDVVKARGDWEAAAAEDEKSSNFDKLVSDFDTYMSAVLNGFEKNASFNQAVVKVAGDIGQLTALRNTVLNNARGSLATFKYTYSTPPDKPATHDATAAFAYVWGDKSKDEGAQITFNAAGSWFASIPAGAKYGRVKDYQLSGEIDQPIGDRKSPRAIFSIAGYGQYQYSANVLKVTVANVIPGTNISVPENSQVFTSTPGWIGVAQTKLVFNIGKGTSIPIAVKWSNKTDLLTGSDWKGQFGLSYDLSALSSMLQAK